MASLKLNLFDLFTKYLESKQRHQQVICVIAFNYLVTVICFLLFRLQLYDTTFDVTEIFTLDSTCHTIYTKV